MNTHFLRATLAALAGLLLVAVGAQAQPVLQNSSISPSTTTSPVGQSQLFTTTWYDSWGPGDFSYFYLNINLYGTYAGGGCLVAGQVNGSYLYLANDAGTAYMGPIQAGSGTLSNSRCTLSGSGSSVSVNGTTGTMVVNLTPTAAFVGTQPLWLWESGNSGYSSPHEQKGTWTIASNSGTDLALNQAARSTPT